MTTTNPRRTAFTQRRRDELHTALPAEYLEGASIRQLAAKHGISYGTVHAMLTRTDTKLRGRGGPNRTRKTT